MKPNQLVMALAYRTTYRFMGFVIGRHPGGRYEVVPLARAHVQDEVVWGGISYACPPGRTWSAYWAPDGVFSVDTDGVMWWGDGFSVSQIS